MYTYYWYKKGLEACSSIARIERRSGRGYGTGWLVNAADFFPGQNGVLLLTNSHVVSLDPTPYSLSPGECQVVFPVINEVLEVEVEIPWSSPYTELDATFLKLKGEPAAPPLRLHQSKLKMVPESRLYMISYEEGRDFRITFQDSHLIALNDKVIHYRTPTDAGSSGSPLFEQNNWEVVGLHHGGSYGLRRLDGDERTYEANEAISISAIQAATKR